MVQILDDQWQHWISENFLNGCNKAEMLKAMLDAGVPETVARYNLASYNTLGASVDANKLAPINPFQPEASYLFQHNNKLVVKDGQIIHVAMRCHAPDIVLLDHFMTDTECDELCALSKSSLTKSTVVDDATGEGVKHAHRSSQGTHFTLGENALVSKIEARISEITGQPPINGEGIQILNYIDGGEYRPNFDYFPDTEGGRANMLKGGQRIITIIMYLNNVTAGGATIFPAINLSVFPKKGSALYFSYFNALGQVDPRTLHGGAPVIQGEKWIATKWIRENAYI
ncbi:MAG: 2OG-Fe(II) oxygenase [Methylophilaceae bacterium]